MRHPLLQKYDRLIEFFGQMLGQDYELSLFDLRAEGCPLIFTAGGLNSGQPSAHRFPRQGFPCSSVSVRATASRWSTATA